MKLIHTLLMLTALTGLSTATIAQDKSESIYQRVMRTGTLHCGYGLWPTFFDRDPNTGELSGMSKEFSDTAARILGLKIDYVEVTFASKVTDLESGKIDAMCGDGPWILTSIKAQDYSHAFAMTPVYLYVRADENRFADTTKLNQASVKFSGVDGDLSTELVQINFPKATLDTLATTADPGQMLLNVADHKADAAILDRGAGNNFIKNNADKVKALSEHPFAVYSTGFGVRKGEQELLNMLNAAVDAAHNTGSVDRILQKYDPDKAFVKRVSPSYIP